MFDRRANTWTTHNIVLHYQLEMDRDTAGYEKSRKIEF